jgi:hypothetical protein
VTDAACVSPPRASASVAAAGSHNVGCIGKPQPEDTAVYLDESSPSIRCLGDYVIVPDFHGDCPHSSVSAERSRLGQNRSAKPGVTKRRADEEII